MLIEMKIYVFVRKRMTCVLGMILIISITLLKYNGYDLKLRIIF